MSVALGALVGRAVARERVHERKERFAKGVIPRVSPPVDEAGDGLVEVGGGRCFSYRAIGDPDGRPVIALHGTPGSRLKFVAAHDKARERGIRVIAPDRWGYGATSLHPAPSLRKFARDMEGFADRLGLDRFSVLGVSGGGPYAVAMAAEMPDRVTALALAAPVGPVADDGDPEVSVFHRLCFGALAQQPATVAVVFGALHAMLEGSRGIEVRAATIAATDRGALWTSEIAARLGATFAEGLRRGTVGIVTDLGMFGAPWNIDPARANVPARIWLGTADESVPRMAAYSLAQRLPQCELLTLEGENHQWIANHYAIMLDWIGSLAR